MENNNHNIITQGTDAWGLLSAHRSAVMGFAILCERCAYPQRLLSQGQKLGYYTDFFVAAVKIPDEKPTDAR